MPLVRHRLDLVLIPKDPELDLPQGAWTHLHAQWQRQGWVVEDRPGPLAHDLVSGGFRRVWLDSPGGVVLYAHHQGGYRVACPNVQELITHSFVDAVRGWRAGGLRMIECPACGTVHSLESLQYRPPAGFAKWAVVISDVESLEPTPTALRALEGALGPLQMILRRVG